MAVIVTMREGSKDRRYVVASEDAYLFDGLPSGPIKRLDRFDGPHFHFGAQWLRGPGRIDEMYRTLYAGDAVRITRKANA